MIKSTSIDRGKAQPFEAVIQRIRILILAIVGMVATLSTTAADFGTPEITGSGSGSNIFISYLQRERGDYVSNSELKYAGFSVKFPSLTSISTTDIQPYLETEDGKTTMYFNRTTLDDNTLYLESPEVDYQLSYYTEKFYLVIPVGAIAAEDGTTNDTEYREPFWNIQLEIHTYLIQSKVIKAINIDSRYDNCNVTTYSCGVTPPLGEYMDYSYGEAMFYDYYHSGNYQINASGELSVNDPSTGKTYSAWFMIWDNMDLDGISSDFNVTTETNSQDHVTRIIVCFPESSAMEPNFMGMMMPIQITDESGMDVYYYSDYNNNELHLVPMDPISTKGNYEVIIPESSVNHVLSDPNYGSVAVPNGQEYRQSFAVEPKVVISGIDEIATNIPALYDVYNAQGIKVASQVDRNNLDNKVGKGIYLLTNGSETLKVVVP